MSDELTPREGEPNSVEMIGPAQAIWIDDVQISVRREIPVGTIAFITKTAPNGPLVEACRIQCSTQTMEQMVEILNRLLQKRKDDLDSHDNPSTD